MGAHRNRKPAFAVLFSKKHPLSCPRAASLRLRISCASHFEEKI
jgi:hypothetical protein